MRRVPPTKDGQLRVVWAPFEGCAPGFVFSYGDGCSKADGALLHALLSTKVHGKTIEWHLMERGYDIGTFKLTIQKKAADAA